MKTSRIGALAVLLIALAHAAVAPAQTLVWSEEFDGPAIDLSTWTFNTGGSGFGNGELQYYTARPENARIEDGSLVIEARRENYLGGKAFTSSRLVTNGRFSFKYGTVEARVKLPNVEYGMWPALWIMGNSFGAVNWPGCGEVDIMEFGRLDGQQAGVVNQRVSAAAHWELNDEHIFTSEFIDRPQLMYEDYHLFKLEWTPQHIQMSVDNIPYYTLDISDPENSDMTEFHEPMFLLTNVAVGGWNFIEITDPNGITAPFPGRMYIDYIRLYDHGDTELHYGVDTEETGEFGVFTETTPVNNSVEYTVDAELFIWNNMTEVTGDAFEGSEAWNFSANPGDWWGMGVLSTQFDRNLKNFSDGHMHLHMKTSSTTPFKIGIKSTTSGESWVPFNEDRTYGLERDGEWHEVVIPLNTFLNCDFNTVSQLFMIAGDPGAGIDISIDNIYWTPSVVRPTPENGNFGIFTEDPAHKTAGEHQLGVDGDVYVWEQTLVEGPHDPYEGTESLSFNSAPGQVWFGAAMTPTIKYNLSAYRFPESKLHFAMKTSSTASFRVGMRSGNVDDIGQKWINFDNGSDPYGFVRDGNWHVVEVPMSEFEGYVNLTEVSILFQTLGVDGPITNIEFDDVCLLNGGTALSANAGYPQADAGDDLVVILPTSSVVIDGSNSFDEDGTIDSASWQQISGPSTADLSGEDTLILTASNLIEGTYKFRLSVTDNESLVGVDDVFVTVATPEPKADAGPDQAIELAIQNSVTLVGSGTDFDGTIVAYAWQQISGPTTATLTDANMATATAGDLVVGTYVFELTVTDNDTNTGTDQMTVEVTNPPQNIALGKATTVSSTGSGDLVRNGGFESGDGTEDAESWQLLAFPAGSSTASATRAMTTPDSGLWHLALSVAGAADGGPVALAQQETPAGSVVGGQTYDLVARARLVGELGPGVVAQLNLQWLNSSSGVVGTTGFLEIAGGLSGSYSDFGFADLVAPTGADRALILLRLAGGAFDGSTAELLFDNISLSTDGPAPLGDYAVDGDDGTFWSSVAGDPQWIEVDLNGSYAISQFVLKWGGAPAEVYDIDVSGDGANWITVFSTSSGAGGTESINVIENASYIRLYAHTGATSEGCSIREFEAYGYPLSVSGLGDLDQNGSVEIADIAHFVDALFGHPPAGAGIQQSNADMNSDGSMDGSDIQLFVDALLS